MKKTYFLAKTWKRMTISVSIGLILTIFIPLASGYLPNKSADFVVLVLLLSFTGLFTYGALTSKIVTSPQGIEDISFGIKVKATWENVYQIEVNSFGIINLFFKESIYKSKGTKFFFRMLSYDRMIQLSPFIDDLAASGLLRDIADYVPSSNASAIIAEQNQKPRTKSGQKVGSLIVYYLGWLVLLVAFAFLSKMIPGSLDSAGFPNSNILIYLPTMGLMIALFLNGLMLIGYNAEISNLDENDIVRVARAHYLSPLFTILLSFVIAVVIMLVLNSLSMVIEDNRVFSLAPMAIGFTSLPVSRFLEKLLFRVKDA